MKMNSNLLIVICVLRQSLNQQFESHSDGYCAAIQPFMAKAKITKVVIKVKFNVNFIFNF